MRMRSHARCGSRPSSPCAVVRRPASRARCNPSEAGSIPTIQIGATLSLRSAFTIKSVPMLPEPINATFTMVTLSSSCSYAALVGKLVDEHAHALDPDAHAIAGLQEAAAGRAAARRGAGGDDITGPQCQARAEM